MSVESSEKLREVLREWAEQDEAECVAPPALEQTLLKAFRARQRSLKMRRLWVIAAVAVAAAVLLAAVLLSGRPATASAPPVTAQVQHAPARLDAVPPAPRTASVHAAKPRRRKSPRPTVQPHPEPLQEVAETVTDFYPISGADTTGPFADTGIVRVELPRTALLAFGLPLNGQRVSQRVKADLILGADGRARAVRFVQ